MSKKKQPSVPKPVTTASPNGRPTTGRSATPTPTTPRPIPRLQTTTSRSAGGRGITNSTVDLPIEERPIAWWPPIVLAVISFLLYMNTFGHGYALDDIAAISQNLFVKSGLKGIPDLLRTEFWHFSNISLGYYRPLSLITFAIEQEYFKDNAGISHQINTYLYALTGFVVGILLQKWLASPKSATVNASNRLSETLFAFLVGLIFIAHPLHTEIVANIKGRDEVLSFLFISLMLLFHFKYLENKKMGWLIGACVSLYLAFLSKESSIVSLGLIPAQQYWFARRNVWQSLASLWPFLIVAALFFYQKKVMIGTLSGTPPVDWANYPYAIEKTQGATTFKFLMYYLKLLLLPHPLVYDYSYNVIPSGRGGDVLVWMGFLSFLALAWLAWKGFIKRTLWGFGLYWFFVTMAPGLGFIFMRGGILAERFLYAAVMGFGFVAVWGLQKLLVKIPTQTAEGAESKSALVRYAPLLAILTVVAGLYSYKTVVRNRDWVNNFVLFNSALPYAPSSCQVQRHVANEWIEKGVKDRNKIDSVAAVVNNVPKADSIRKLMKLATREDLVKKAQAIIDTNQKWANQHARWALDHLKEATQIYPGFGEAFFSMAYVFQRITPNRDSAVYYYKQTIRAANAYAPAYNNLGVIYQNEGKLQLASYYYNKSMEVNPAYQDGKNNHAALKKATGLDVKFLPDSVLTKN